ncbi:MAG: hypothetical protein A4E38_00076 [Methanoregulaceae archaeon PtaB.Bin108]|nr:MAG: hypothetical protein A4E38_00076 [Methanoregulaceae archaeon PtaB.Bin108]
MSTVSLLSTLRLARESARRESISWIIFTEFSRIFSIICRDSGGTACPYIFRNRAEYPSIARRGPLRSWETEYVKVERSLFAAWRSRVLSATFSSSSE